MGSGFAKMKKQLAKLQEEMQHAEHKGSSGNGLVEVVVTGDKKLKSIQIKKECVDPSDVEGLQDLILAAFEDAEKKAEGQLPFGF